MSSCPSLTTHFSVLPDPRIERSKRYPLMDILFIGLCAVLCGAEGFVDMEQFGKAKEPWLRERFALKNGIPSHDTFRGVFSLLEPTAWQDCFVSWTQAIHKQTPGEIIALDGKRLRHFLDTASGQAALHLLSAWTSTNGLALGALKVDSKSNEISAIPALLSRLDIAGCIVTTDAMGCQKAIAHQIAEQGGDHVLALKDTHPALREDVGVSLHTLANTTLRG